jgi:cation:H+ antiporter
MEDIFLIIAGLFALFLGGESLIKGSVSIAKNLKLSQILVSSVIVGFGTSMPEMTVSVNALLKGSADIAIGNVIGSNIANILLILGVCSTIAPIVLSKHLIERDVYVMLLATLLLCVFGLLGSINFVGGIIMLCFLVLHISSTYLKDKKKFANIELSSLETNLDHAKNMNLPVSLLLSIGGILLLILGSSLFLKGAVSLAEKFHISDEIIGLGIVAVGTCLPELATSIVASIKKQGDIIIAGILGSNIFNILSIVGFITLLEEITFPKHIVTFDLWIFLISTVILSCMLIMEKTFNRKTGFFLLLTYVMYFYILFNY